jgi:hypothetical protein
MKHHTVGERVRTKTVKLSPAQQRLLAEIVQFGKSEAPTGWSNAGCLASAWHRTAQSLKNLGLITIESGGGYAYTARLAQATTGEK